MCFFLWGGANFICYIKEMSLSEVLTVKKQTQKSLLIKQSTDGFIYVMTTSAQDQPFADVLQNRCSLKFCNIQVSLKCRPNGMQPY